MTGTFMPVFDHAFFFVLTVAYPAASFFSYRRLLRRIAAGETVRPTEIYRSTMIGHWALFGLLLILWLVNDRPFAALGFTRDIGAGFLIGLALTVVMLIVVMRNYGGLDDASEKTRDAIRRQLAELVILMPRDRRELREFYGLSVTAGIVEETMWRGYMFWYLGHVMPLWAAALISTVLFGLSHAYQGPRNIPMVALAGAVFAALYLLTGSIWLPMLLHAVFDAVQGRAVYKALAKEAPPAEQPRSGERA
ncbi:MAG: CPBP family intramembrane metalloprotease [Woeseiaceae bacterium]|nr:CPBP family intramembrane metalloprotease [Gammaproteobacteria bacterium]NNK24301.1 CPBP family intramembrane metalloprotease [Woeseiaceae bacterium]NNL62825.1 CPBP family intramembrane metalloprotease [Woeseiaceae bacterium]